MKKHELKCWPEFFRPTMRGKKLFEIRLDDRGFRMGHELLLREWDPHTGKYSGNELLCEVLHTSRDAPGLEPRHIIMSIKVKQIINPEKQS